MMDSEIAGVINDLLIENGYSPDEVNSWWRSPGPDGRRPKDRWRVRGERLAIYTDLSASYAASRRSVQEQWNDPEWVARVATMRDKLDRLYGDD